MDQIQSPETQAETPLPPQIDPAAVNAALHSAAAANRNIAALAQQIKAQAPPAAKPEEPKGYSLADLEQAVRDSRITQAQAQTIWQEQEAKRVERLVQDGVQKGIERYDTEISTLSEIDAYKDMIGPALMQEGTAVRNKVARAFSRLAQNGHDGNSYKTELLAMRLVFGDLDEARAQARRPPQGFQDQGGGSPGPAQPSQVNGVSAPHRAYYEKLIAQGRYTGWDDPRIKSEMSYLRGKMRRPI